MSSKLREALSEIIDTIDKWRSDGLMEHWQYSQLYDVADVALAEPLRNYEVGTIKEQRKRFHMEYYSKHSRLKRRWSVAEAALEWAQMPCEEAK